MPRPNVVKTTIIATAILATSIASLIPATAAQAAAAFTLSGAEGTKSAKAGANVNVQTLFTSNTAKAGTYVLDTEVYSGSKKVSQWTRTWTVKPGERKRVTQSWNTSGLGAGQYTIKTGIFDPAWNTNYAWSSSAGTVTLTGEASTPAPEKAPVINTPSVGEEEVVADKVGAGSPVSGASFAANPNGQAFGAAASLRSQGRAGDAATIEKLANTPTAVWLGGWSKSSDVSSQMKYAANGGKTAVFVAYNIPHRDCGSYSSGGASSLGAYKGWIDDMASGIGSGKAVVVVEPDALAGMDCLDNGGQRERFDAISYAVDTLGRSSNTSVYVDAGHADWKSASLMADRLRSAGVNDADGFSLNVSGYDSTGNEATFGDELSSKLGGKGYVIDTSRNGNGSNGQWCNPSGRTVGSYPTTETGRANVDAYLWLKAPGESDGTCNGGPGAGQFWTERALDLMRG